VTLAINSLDITAVPTDTQMETKSAKNYATSLDVKVNVNFTFPSVSKAAGSECLKLLFLHFWGGSSSTFSKVIQKVSSNYATISLDFRGWGKSTGPSDGSAYGIQNLAADVESILSEINTNEDKYILVGHSMGGKVAQMITGRGKTPVIGLVLVASAPPGPLRLPDDMRETQIHAYDNRGSAEFVVKNVLTASHVDEETISLLVDDMVRGKPEAKVAWPEYGMAEDITDWSRKIKVPVLAIAAEKDQVEPVERIKTEICTIVSQAELIVLGGGHLIPIEQSELLADEILKFVTKIKG
jgi:3-oxoadipate enol-lactonase